jgi:coenzyme PQQ precursor peptide PqqA
MKTWTAPQLIEICIGMEVTGYESAEGDTLH